MQQGQAGNPSQLASLLGVSERSIHRDLSVLNKVGVPCYFDADVGGYRVRKDFFLPPVQLTASETLALLSLTESISGQDQIAMTGPAARAMEKIRGQLPQRVLAELGDVNEHININLPANGPPREAICDVFDRVRQAIHSRRALKCEYESLNTESDAAPFIFKPYALAFDQRAWYTVGHHSRRHAVRRLKLNRFTAVRLTDQPYAIPDDFSLEVYRGNAWRMIRGDQTYHVNLTFDAQVAETVADTNWHPTQQIEEHLDGSLTFDCEVDGLDEIVWWVLGYGPHAHVHEPAELAQRVAALAKATAEKYRESD